MSSEIKVFRVVGTYIKDHQEYLFRKEKRALKEEDAVEQVLSEISSIGLFRRKIKITEVKELKREEITNTLILQLLDQ